MEYSKLLFLKSWDMQFKLSYLDAWPLWEPEGIRDLNVFDLNAFEMFLSFSA